jgi:replicative DNA helicase|tara:strand:+ start:5678 stop:6754 length:1077 start_codon:yes stop_codon:yes gene_type:complete
MSETINAEETSTKLLEEDFDSIQKIQGELESFWNTTAQEFEEKHKKKYSEGGLVTGFDKIDEKLFFAKGDFNVIQAPSNHGKTSFMVELAYRFLTEDKNKNDVTCIFITYESSPDRVTQKIKNLIGDKTNKKPPYKYMPNGENKYEYLSKDDTSETYKKYDELVQNKRLSIISAKTISELEQIIDIFKRMNKNNNERDIVIFTDYIQIMQAKDTSITGWEKMKAIAYELEKLAIEKEIILFTGSQENNQGNVREGSDIYNAATNVIKLFNHSHDKVQTKEKKDEKFCFIAKQDGWGLFSLSIEKAKYFETAFLDQEFRFNGYSFKPRDPNGHKDPEDHKENNKSLSKNDRKQVIKDYQ